MSVLFFKYWTDSYYHLCFDNSSHAFMLCLIFSTQHGAALLNNIFCRKFLFSFRYRTNVYVRINYMLDSEKKCWPSSDLLYLLKIIIPPPISKSICSLFCFYVDVNGKIVQWTLSNASGDSSSFVYIHWFPIITFCVFEGLITSLTLMARLFIYVLLRDQNDLSEFVFVLLG